MEKKVSYQTMIPVSCPSLGNEELSEVKKVLDSHWLGMGKWVFEFEKKIKDFIGAGNVIAVNTGTTAIHLALDAIGLSRGDEVIVPSLTFAGSVQPILNCGARPVFCDIDARTLNMDVADMRRKINRKTKVIMPVHYSGLACDMDAILKTAEKYSLRVIEDAAHAFGSLYKGRKIGSFADVTCFSFDPIKNITCGEGGAIVTSDDNLAQTIYRKRILGIDRDTWSRYSHKREWFYNVVTTGYRYHLSNINAAIGIIQIGKIDRFLAKKRQLIRIYDAALGGVKGIELLMRDYENTAPFNYVIKVTRCRDRLMEFLKARGIDSGVNYIPNHLQPVFRPYKTALPVTERVWEQILTLPLYCDMSRRDINRIIGCVKEFFTKNA